MSRFLVSNLKKFDATCTQFIRCFANQESYLTTDDRNLLKKQAKFPRLTSQIYVQNQEVKQKDGYSLVEPLLDQNATPHELHLIKKTASVVGEPWWIKKALKDLGFKSHYRTEWNVTFAVQPNTVDVNNLLMQCKHMVKVLPIKFKNGHPSEKDIPYTHINLETGELEIGKPTNVFEINGVSVTTDLQTSSSFPLTSRELKRSIHRQKELGQLNAEYFPTVYDYKYGQEKPGAIRVRGRPDTSIKEDELDN